jgi:negative regulator of replication initiation
MKPIEIDDEVHDALSNRARGFNDTPNMVLRRLLELGDGNPTTHNGSSKETVTVSRMTEFLRSDGFQRHHQVVDRYLAILGFAHRERPAEFARLENFSRGRRIYFAKTREAVESSGQGVKASSIPNSAYWTLTTLDNRTKRAHLEEVLRILGYTREEITEALRNLPDSGIRRRHVNLDEYH